jgi:hypothetical protein
MWSGTEYSGEQYSAQLPIGGSFGMVARIDLQPQHLGVNSLLTFLSGLFNPEFVATSRQKTI